MHLSRDLIQDYLDDRLSAQEKLDVEVEVAQHAEIALQIARLRAVNTAVGLIGIDQLKATLPETIIRALNEAMVEKLDHKLSREQQSNG